MTTDKAALPFAPYAQITPERGNGTRAELGAFGSW
jgi:hypothetical protein